MEVIKDIDKVLETATPQELTSLYEEHMGALNSGEIDKRSFRTRIKLNTQTIKVVRAVLRLRDLEINNIPQTRV